MSNLTQTETSFLNHLLLHRAQIAEYQANFQQAKECTQLAFQLASRSLENTDARTWLANNSGPLWQGVFDESSSRDVPTPFAFAADIDLARFFEDRLHRSIRKQFGVFYTPHEVAFYIAKRTDQLLRDEFQLADGLADTTTWGEFCARHQLNPPKIAVPDDPFVQILDPAAGTGVFLVKAIEVVYQTLRTKWQAAGCSHEDVNRRWNDYVPRHLLSRLYGVESMLPAAAIAHVNIAAKLADTGFQFAANQRLRVFVANSLVGPNESNERGDAWPDSFQRELDLTNDVRHGLPITVVLGNPPYSAASNNRNRWIEDLIRGRDELGNRTANYYEIDGAALRERKLWLHDDYVKFMRYSQWRLQRTGCGVLALVTNHGYLDNPTFRGMRQQLMQAFPRVTIVDLHGNRKKKERAPGGGPDENVFDIEQGVAIGLFRKLSNTQDRHVEYCDVWGSRKDKLQWLAGDHQTEAIQPHSPFYFFVPRNESRRKEYARGFKLTDIMPVNTTAAVTARDRFVIAARKEDLLERLRDFGDRTIPDDEIRRRYFTNSRSRHFSPGDTRGWNLAEARRRLAKMPDWQRQVRTCLYRPFDRRFIFWADWMIDWPRREVMQHMQQEGNVALVARRQMPGSEPCNYFWIADDIVIDGYIRSDNRGSESVFPLYLCEGPGVRRANFAPSFITSVQQSFGLRWVEQGGGDLQATIGPLDVFRVIYATFHSSEYRERFADQLRIDFPRIFLPRNVTILRDLCRAGEMLVGVDLATGANAASRRFELVFDKQADVTIDRGHPKYVGNKIYLNADAYFANVPQETWDRQVGAYQVCRKWLTSRRGQTLTERELSHFQCILQAAEAHARIVAELDRQIQQHGGWDGAFVAATEEAFPHDVNATCKRQRLLPFDRLPAGAPTN